MKELIRHIEYLVQRYDCVILPGLGAILSHCDSARWDAATSSWQAPRRVMSFNSELNRSDGLLAGSVSRRRGISVEAAAASVNTAIAEMQRVLAETGSVSVGAVGKISRTSHGTLLFEPGVAEWLSPSMLWLPTVSVAARSHRAVASNVEVEQSVRRFNIGKALRRTAAAIAIAAVIGGLGWSIKTYLPEVSGEQQASVVPTPAREQVSSTVAEAEEPGTLVLVINRHDEQEEAVQEPVVEEVAEEVPAQVVEPALNAEASYFLVVASLASQEEAQKFVNNSTINLGILPAGPYYRVYAASGNTADEVLKAKQGDIAERYPDAWVCRR